jgi:hypothetical protein
MSVEANGNSGHVGRVKETTTARLGSRLPTTTFPSDPCYNCGHTRAQHRCLGGVCGSRMTLASGCGCLWFEDGSVK